MKTYVLWHPESPGVRVLVRRPSLLRRLGINQSAFATARECYNEHSAVYFYPITERTPTADVDLTLP